MLRDKEIEITDVDLKKSIARKILESLFEWFEIEDSREEYIADCASWIFFAAKKAEDYVGFLCLKRTGKKTLELAVMGVLKDYHRKGVGKALFEKAKKRAIKEGGFIYREPLKTSVFRGNFENAML